MFAVASALGALACGPSPVWVDRTSLARSDATPASSGSSSSPGSSSAPGRSPLQVAVAPPPRPVEKGPLACGVQERIVIGSRAYCINRRDLNFAEAEDECRGMRGHLAAITDRDEQEALRARLTPTSALPGAAWLGLVEPFNEGDWRWVNGDRATFFNWAAGEPNDAGGEDCGQIGLTDGRWNDLSCFARIPYICQSAVAPAPGRGPRPPAPPSAAPAAKITCTGDGQRLTAGPLDLCVHSGALNFAEAQESCRKSGGHLAVIRSADEGQALQKAFGSPIGPVAAIWIGATDEESEGRFVWTSGEAASFSDWNGGEPNNQGVENCATWIAASGKWNDVPCGVRMWSLCEGSATE